MSTPVVPAGSGAWPRAVRLLLDAIATVLMRAYWLGRCRAAGHASSTVRAMAERDDALWRLALAERMLAVQCRRIAAMNPYRRPEVLPEDMARRMQLRLDLFKAWYNARRPHQALGGWTPVQAWSESGPPTAVAIRARDPQPEITILRHRYRGDSRLPDLEIRIDWAA